MPRALSVNLRERSLHALASGMSVTEVAHLVGVSRIPRTSIPSSSRLPSLRPTCAAWRRALDPLVTAIGDGLGRITTADIAGYYRHRGFALIAPETQPS